MHPSSGSQQIVLECASSSEDAQMSNFKNDANEVLVDDEELTMSGEESTEIHTEDDSHRIDDEPSTTCVTPSETDNSNHLSFTISEESIVLPESNYIQMENTPPTSYSNSRELHILCDDSSSHDTLPPCMIFANSVPAPNDDFFASNGEESSMDSGLGSVESVYPTSEDDTVLSPINYKNEEQTPQVSSTNEVVDQSGVIAKIKCDSPPTVKLFDVGATLLSDTLHTPNQGTSTTASKRPREENSDNEEGLLTARKIPRKKKKVNFQDVTVFYFPRKQGFVSVPSQGGSTLGMAMKHTEFTTMTVQDYHNVINERHHAKLREHVREQKMASEMLQLQYMNQGYQASNLASISESSFSSGQGASNAEIAPSLDSVDEYFFLQPVTAKKRRKLLRAAGVERIDGEEKLENRFLRESRELCGCNCRGVCLPDSCECHQAGIQCQVDRESFPCGCIPSGCHNENGRIEFNPERVRNHLLETLKRFTESGECNDDDDEEASASDSEQSATYPERKEDSSAVQCDSTSAKSCDHSANREEPEVRSPLPADYLRTLHLKRVDFPYSEDHCLSSELRPAPVTTALSDYQRVSDVTSYPEPYAQQIATNCIPEHSENAQGQLVLPIGISDHDVFSPSVSVSNILNESYRDARYDHTLSLEPIDTFMSSNFVVSSAADLHSTLNFSSSL